MYQCGDYDHIIDFVHGLKLSFETPGFARVVERTGEAQQAIGLFDDAEEEFIKVFVEYKKFVFFGLLDCALQVF